MKKVSAVLLVAVTIAGCHSTAPIAVKMGRPQINNAVQSTDNQQMLHNLVRLRYRDVPYFLSLTSVTTSVEWGVGGSAGGKLYDPRSASKPDEWSFGGAADYKEKPTITYMPLDGEKFVKQLMAPVNTNVLTLLYHSGWSISRICRLLLQNINGLPNAPTATGPTPDKAPRFKEFMETAKLLRTLQENQDILLMLGKPADSGAAHLQLYIKPNARKSPEVDQLCKLLRISPENGKYSFQPGVFWETEDRIVIYPRSLMASLYYLSQSVEVPQEHIDEGVVTVTKNPDGSDFNWDELMDGLMEVHYSKNPPKNAYVKTQHRGYWFYIDDSDLDSKSTFCLLMQLFRLQAGGEKANAPLLTIPVQ